ncbi:MAG: efflux RND transporter permease subunit, partial [Gammaproteobacteria bacterium]|nr:efflux RND transporter permease subunit [Gammaproteobacteria bacterium]
PIGTGATVPLSALGPVRVGPPPRLRGGAVGGWPHALLIDIAAQAHANVETVARAVAHTVARLRRHLPPGVHLVATYDVAGLIAGSLHDVWLALIIGTVITFGVLLLFLGRADIAAATVLVVPLSLAGTFVVLHGLHLGLNIMTLGGLTAAIGALVDHAIVVMEQASHRARAARAEDRLQQALAASADVLPMMSFATLTSALVFVPLIFLGGTTGILFRQMAVALVSALVISQLVALSVTPLLAGFMSHRTYRPPRRSRAVRRARVFYARLLRRLLRRPLLGFGVTALIALATYAVFAGLPTAFLPAWNEGLIAVPYRTAAAASAADTLAVGRRLLRAALADPAVATGSVVAGQSLGNPRAPANKGDLVLTVRPGYATEPVITALRRRFRALEPSLTMLKLHQMLVTELGNLTGAHSPLDINLFGPDPTILAHQAERLKAALVASHDFANVSLPAAYSGPTMVFAPRTKALLRGLGPHALARQMQAAFWGRPAGFLLRGNQILPIRVHVPPASATGGRILPEAWTRLPAHTSLLPLSALARARPELHQPFINHQNLVPYVDIQLHPRRGEGLNVAAAAARRIVDHFALPASITAHLGGYYREQTASFLQMGVTLMLALLLLLILVGYQLGALRPALAVLLATAQAALGALLALRLRGIALDSTAFLGVLLVFAVVVNNGILIFAQARLHQAVPGRLAVELACRRRLRPILMTMVADVAGFLPLAIGIGHGTDLLKPLATAVMGGLSVAIVASLVIGPMLYVGLGRRR